MNCPSNHACIRTNDTDENGRLRAEQSEGIFQSPGVVYDKAEVQDIARSCLGAINHFTTLATLPPEVNACVSDFRALFVIA